MLYLASAIVQAAPTTICQYGSFLEGYSTVEFHPEADSTIITATQSGVMGTRFSGHVTANSKPTENSAGAVYEGPDNLLITVGIVKSDQRGHITRANISGHFSDLVRGGEIALLGSGEYRCRSSDL